MSSPTDRTTDRMRQHVYASIAGGVDGAQLWSVKLDQPAAVVGQLSDLLSDTERTRALTQHSAAAQQRFIVARGALRLILADATGIPVHTLAFCYGADGKPVLEPSGSIVAPHFNVSHSRDLALVVVAGARPVGIDLEWTEGTSPFEGVAARYFSAAERMALDAAPASERRHWFYRIWVRKEAYLKARGEGISQHIYETDFSSIEVGVATGDMGVRDQDRWIMSDITALPTGFVGSVALARSDA